MGDIQPAEWQDDLPEAISLLNGVRADLKVTDPVAAGAVGKALVLVKRALADLRTWGAKVE
ncbi:MAG: hypothetical protein OXG38_09620 [Chloroflexi bacterium]|nr:hypothetical protein [Chloroflexota bacterium]